MVNQEDITRPSGGRQDLGDIHLKGYLGHGVFQHPRGRDVCETSRRQAGLVFTRIARRGFDDAFTGSRTSKESCQTQRRPAFP